MIDANQVWEVNEAIDWVRELAFAKPWFIEEPTSPDDVDGHRKIREAIAPGQGRDRRDVPEPHHVQAVHHARRDRRRADRFVPTRRVNEVLAVMLMAAKYDLPVWPHAGGVGLCEYVQHLSMIDYLALPARSAGASSNMSTICTSTSSTRA